MIVYFGSKILSRIGDGDVFKKEHSFDIIQ